MNNLLWTSTPIEESPHIRLLREFQRSGEGLFASGKLEATDYFRNATRNIETFGSYYGAKSEEELIEMARSSTGRLNRIPQPKGDGVRSVNTISVKRIEGTRYYQIADDPHTVALACAADHRNFRVSVARKRTRTALQELLDRVLWFDGNRELYQPIDAPEIRDSWFLTRKCTDRLEKMQRFLAGMALDGKSAKVSYLDIGSFYGWFVQKMVEFGLDGYGVERDPIAAEGGVWVLRAGTVSCSYWRGDRLASRESVRI